MKILALEKEQPGVKPEQYQPHLRAEAARVWALYQRRRGYMEVERLRA